MTEEKNNSTIPVHEDVLPDAHIDTCIHVGVMPHVRKPYMRVTEAAWDSIAHTFLTRDRAEKDGPGFVAVKACVVADDRALRRNENVELVTMLMLDVEDHDVSHDGVDESDSDAVMAWFWSHIASILGVDLGDLPAHIAYTTASHGLREVDGKPKWSPGCPRFRVVVPYATPIDPETHTRLMAVLCDALPGMDTGARDLARLMYTARVHSEAAEVPAWDVRHDGTHLLDPSRFVLPEPQPEQDRPRAHARARSVITAPTDRPTREDVIKRAKAVVEYVTEQASIPAPTPDLIELAFHPWTTSALATLEADGVIVPGEVMKATLKAAKCHIKTQLAKAIKDSTPIDLDAIGKLAQDQAITRTSAGFALTPEALAEALTHVELPARGGYDLWRDIGMALADYAREGHISQSDAEAVFVGWSRDQPGFQGDDDCVKTMKSFRGRGITIGTLIHHAREGGWTPPRGSGMVTGMPADVLMVGDEAEVAKTLLAGMRVEVSPEVRGVNEHGTSAVLRVSDTPTAFYSGGAVWAWDREDGIFIEQSRKKTLATLTNSWSGASVACGDGERLLKIGRTFASGVHELMGAVAHDACEVPQDAWMRPEGCVGAVAVEGGVLLLSEDGEVATVEDHPVWMQRSRIAADYQPELARGASHWQSFLDDVFGTDDEGMARQRAVQEYVGATVFGFAHSLQKILLLAGGGVNGKGTLMRAISRLIPDHARVAVTPQQMKDTSREGMHLLLTARLNLVGDVDRGDLVETGLLKRVTGEDEVSFAVKYEAEPRRGTVRCGHIWSINGYPAVRDQSVGFWRRWRIIRFDRSFAGKEDPGLEGRLARDLPAILAWAVEGAQRLIKQGMKMTIPACHHEEIAVWKTDTDSAREFVIMHADESARHSPAQVYEAYHRWTTCVGRGTLKKREFLSRLKQLADAGDVTRVNASGAIKYGLALYPVLDTDETPTAISAHRRTPDPETTPFTHEKTIARPAQGWSSVVEDLKDVTKPAPAQGANDDGEVDYGGVDTEVIFRRLTIGMDG